MNSEGRAKGSPGRWKVGVREKGMKDGTLVLARITGRKGLGKNGGGAGVGVDGNQGFRFELGGREMPVRRVE